VRRPAAAVREINVRLNIAKGLALLSDFDDLRMLKITKHGDVAANCLPIPGDLQRSLRGLWWPRPRGNRTLRIGFWVELSLQLNAAVEWIQCLKMQIPSQMVTRFSRRSDLLLARPTRGSRRWRECAVRAARDAADPAGKRPSLGSSADNSSKRECSIRETGCRSSFAESRLSC
jgi:hypothetical protein